MRFVRDSRAREDQDLLRERPRDEDDAERDERAQERRARSLAAREGVAHQRGRERAALVHHERRAGRGLALPRVKVKERDTQARAAAEQRRDEQRDEGRAVDA